MSMTNAAAFTYSPFVHTVAMAAVEHRLLRRLPLEPLFASARVQLASDLRNQRLRIMIGQRKKHFRRCEICHLCS